jgi:hypothetical protein
MAPNIGSQDLKKLEDVMETSNKEQTQWNDKMTRLLEQQGQ